MAHSPLYKTAALLLLSMVCSAADNDKGLPDAEAVVGKMFIYTILPEYNTLKGRFELLEATGEPLPKWLTYVPSRRQLIGVPAADDIGPLQVALAHRDEGARKTGAPFLDVFTIHVREFVSADKRYMSADDLWRPCDGTDKLVLLLIELDDDFHRMDALRRAGIIERVARTLQVPTSATRLYATAFANSHVDPVALAASADAPHSKTDTSVAALSLGCGGALTGQMKDSLRQAVQTVSDGGLKRATGIDVLSWQASSSQSLGRRRRGRQQASIYSSPYRNRVNSGLNIMPSTERPEPPPKGLDDWTVSWSNSVTARLETETQRSSRAPDRSTSTTPRPTTTTSTSTTSTTTTTTTTTTTPTTTTSTTTPTTSTTSTATTRTPELTSTVWYRPAPTTPRPVTGVPPTRRPNDSKPRVHQSLVSYTCVKGELCIMTIPKHTFLDDRDGWTFSMRLDVEPLDSASGNWIVLERTADEQTEHMVGFTMIQGVFHYRLTATDSNGGTASDAFQVEVLDSLAPGTHYSHKIDLTLAYDFEKFKSNPVSVPIELFRRFANAMGDSDATQMTVRRIGPGSTVLSYSNNTLPMHLCDWSTLNALKDRLFEDAHDIALSSSTPSVMGRPAGPVAGALRPHFKLVAVSVKLEEACLRDEKGGPVPVQGGAGKPDNDQMGDGAQGRSDLMWSLVLPLLVILILVLVALLVACCLYARNRKHRLAVKKHAANNEYMSRGLPVVFPEELDAGDKEPLNATAPALIAEERPPLSVPLTDMSGTQSLRGKSRTPGLGSAADMGVGSPLLSHSTTEHENPLYKPPPPIDAAAQLGHSPTPRRAGLNRQITPGHRPPPLYVPP